MNTTHELPEQVQNEAAEILLIDTLETRNTGEDFHEVSVWQLRRALAAAYEAGKAAGGA